MTLPATPGRRLVPYLASALAGFLLALLLGWSIWHVEPVREGPAFERPLPSGGIIVRRDPEAPAPADTKRAAREAGGKLERAVSIKVQPKAAPAAPATLQDSLKVEQVSDHSPDAENMVCSCAPVTVDLGLVRMPDQTRRVVATSPDGVILDAVDIPIDTAAPARAARWAAGVTVGYTTTGRQEYGAFLDRDLGPLRLGVEVGQREGGAAVVLRAGVRF